MRRVALFVVATLAWTLLGGPPDTHDRGAHLVLARPTSGDPATAPNGVRYTVAPAPPVDTPRFRVHYVTSSPDAAMAAFANEVAQVMEEVWRAQVDRLGWAPPVADGSRGGDSRVDVYLADVSEHGFGGFAAVDPGQHCQTADRCGGFHGYIVLDNDFAHAPVPADMLRIAAAHEFNHLLQFRHTVVADPWWMEATAEWAATATFPDINISSRHLRHWGTHTQLPLTDFDRDSGGRTKAYGSYVWNDWLADRHGAALVRRAWEAAPQVGSFSLHAYESVLAEHDTTFAEEFVRFAAATAEWRTGVFPRSAGYPDVRRVGDVAAALTVPLRHTAFALYDVAARGRLDVTVTAPDGMAGGVALVARRGNQVTAAVEMTSGGTATVRLDAPDADRVTLVLVNADTASELHGDVWDHDQRRFAHDPARFGVEVSAVVAPGTLGADVGGRVSGGGSADPVGQAIATSRVLFPEGSAERVVLATADRFPDALAGTALAGAHGPILLTAGLGGLERRVADEIARVSGGGAPVLVLGGTAAVSEAAAAAARAAAGSVPCQPPLPASCRLGGTGREHTAALVADVVLAEHGGGEALVARSDDFADAITGGAYAAAAGMPVLLTPHGAADPHMVDVLRRRGVRRVTVLGGTAAVSDAVVAALGVADVRRIAGRERTETAARIAAELWQASGRGRGGTLLVNVRHPSGWQTALTAAVAAARVDAPQLGVDFPGVLPAATGEALRVRGGPVVAFGDPALVSDALLHDARAAAAR